MKHWNITSNTETTYIQGTGIVLSIDLRRCGLAADEWMEELPIHKGDTIESAGTLYKITAVQAFRNLFDGKVSTKVGLVVKKLSTE